MGTNSASVVSGSSSIGGTESVHNVFVYGSLLADEVVLALLNRVPHSSPAILNNFHRYSIKGRVYPAILPVEKKIVTGKVLSGITDPELYILDAFEDCEYERRIIDVSLMDGSEKLQANAYIWSNSCDPNLYGEWDFEEWKKQHMNDFLKMTMEFVEELELPESASQELKPMDPTTDQNNLQETKSTRKLRGIWSTSPACLGLV